MRRNLMLVLAPLPALCLASCGKDVIVERVPVPARFLTCAAEPAPPAEDTDKAVAGFIVDLIEAGADCRSKLAAIKQWSSQP